MGWFKRPINPLTDGSFHPPQEPICDLGVERGGTRMGEEYKAGREREVSTWGFQAAGDLPEHERIQQNPTFSFCISQKGGA